MKNIIILTYFFPPANFVASDRIAAWAKHLHLYGYYPTIITRNWNEGQIDLTDKIKDNSLKHEVFDTHEVYRLPYNRTIRDWLNDYPQNSLAKFFRKTFSLLELILNNFSLRSIPYANFYDFTKTLIHQHPGKYELIIASGRPFQLFSIAHLLNKTTGIKWIADYRDEWSTFQNTSNQSFLQSFVAKLEARSERKWLASSTLFTTVSKEWEKSISNYINKNGCVVMNGFNDDESFSFTPIKDKHKLEIAYVGTIYPIQEIEVFVAAIGEIIERHQKSLNIVVNFIGIDTVPGQKERIENAAQKYASHFRFFIRMPKQKLTEFYKQSDLLLATGFKGIKGWYPVKIFEYCNTGIPILLCPSDNDVMEKLVCDLHAGYVAQTKEECVAILTKIIEDKLAGKNWESKIDRNALDYFSRKNQTQVLAGLLNQIQ